MDTLKMGSDKKNVTPPLDKTSTKCYTNIVKKDLASVRRVINSLLGATSSEELRLVAIVKTLKISQKTFKKLLTNF